MKNIVLLVVVIIILACGCASVPIVKVFTLEYTYTSKTGEKVHDSGIFTKYGYSAFTNDFYGITLEGKLVEIFCDDFEILKRTTQQVVFYK